MKFETLQDQPYTDLLPDLLPEEETFYDVEAQHQINIQKSGVKCEAPSSSSPVDSDTDGDDDGDDDIVTESHGTYIDGTYHADGESFEDGDNFDHLKENALPT